jgi:hypothetical protein
MPESGDLNAGSPERPSLGAPALGVAGLLLVISWALSPLVLLAPAVIALVLNVLAFREAEGNRRLAIRRSVHLKAIALGLALFCVAMFAISPIPEQPTGGMGSLIMSPFPLFLTVLGLIAALISVVFLAQSFVLDWFTWHERGDNLPATAAPSDTRVEQRNPEDGVR